MRMLYMKGQTAVEFTVILAVLLIVLLSVVGVIMDVPSSFVNFGKQRDVAAWQAAPVGVESILLSGSTLYITIVNNQRFPVIVESVSLDDVAATPAGSSVLQSGERGLYTVPAGLLVRLSSTYPRIVYSDVSLSFSNSTVQLPVPFPINR